jgi:hypothetical protein
MRKTPALLLLIALRAVAAAAAADPSRTEPAFWLDRAARDVAPAKDVVEYDGPTPRVTAFESAADLYRAAPTPANRKLLEDKLAAGETQLAAATQPWRRWYGQLIIARVYRAALKDDAAYRRHLAAADALAKFLPNRDRDTPLYRVVRGAEFAAAGDADALRRECAAATAPAPAPNATRFAWYAGVVSRCIDLGHPDGARAALDQLAADASVPSAAKDRPIADGMLTVGYSMVGDDAAALETLSRLDGPQRFRVAVILFRAARRAGQTDVTRTIESQLAGVLPPTAGPDAGVYVTQLAAAGNAPAARDIGRAALQRGPAAAPASFYASLAAGLFAAGDRESAAAALTFARDATAGTTEPRARAAALLELATAHARAADWDAMTTAAAEAARIGDVPDKELAAERGLLVDTLIDLRRWDDASRQLAPIRAKPDRDAWMPRIVIAQVRAGATDLAVANANTLQGFIRARCVRAIAIERAKRGDLDTLPAWVDQQDTPLRRAATNLAVAQVLAKQPPVASGFPPDED